ncbi:hypothetical protein CCAE64S_00930 [Castellaniella caeni]
MAHCSQQLALIHTSAIVENDKCRMVAGYITDDVDHIRARGNAVVDQVCDGRFERVPEIPHRRREASRAWWMSVLPCHQDAPCDFSRINCMLTSQKLLPLCRIDWQMCESTVVADIQVECPQGHARTDHPSAQPHDVEHSRKEHLAGTNPSLPSFRQGISLSTSCQNAARLSGSLCSRSTRRWCSSTAASGIDTKAAATPPHPGPTKSSGNGSSWAMSTATGDTWRRFGLLAGVWPSSGSAR